MLAKAITLMRFAIFRQYFSPRRQLMPFSLTMLRRRYATDTLFSMPAGRRYAI